ncbi:LytTR family DNA-binding domain-containing protein [Pelotomaculum isophthalicicum JI]|uniref:Stage 0 sporulation protein A homolog n=1 Tax=Pelotomaculum isophthalicicum JI TaxID=947010 RepID=A0A9X4H9D6_9FIRM|nr:LytTR family DNA-binding domain-containing protein [Pelotomaculum isophthalicicum]MDF9410054.1 LytTR family DNA-binding domain-containing protein [Pelotomaculum isophthalicicum JI]
MVNILLLEDEHYTRKFLKKLVSENPSVDKVIDTPSGEEAINFAREHKLDIALLDIELAPEEGLNGILVAKKIHDFNPDIFFVFITGYSQYAIDSFAVHPYDYILKPVKKAKINEIINSLTEEIRKRNIIRRNPEKIKIKDKNEIFMVAPGDILFIEKQDKLNLIHTENNVYKIHQTLSKLAEKLGGNFLRVHKSFIANMDNISRIREVSNRSYVIEFDGYDKVALMSRYKFEEHKHRFAPL